MMTDDELLADLKSRQDYENATGPEIIGGKKFFRVGGFPVSIEKVREIVGDTE